MAHNQPPGHDPQRLKNISIATFVIQVVCCNGTTGPYPGIADNKKVVRMPDLDEHNT
jgi:hypothetical protein